MHQEIDSEQPKLIAKFIKLHNGEDLVAYVLEQNDEFIRIQKPMEIHMENDLPSARQMLNVREWIPPLIVKVDVVELPLSDVMLVLELTEHFQREFGDIVSFFYNVKPVERDTESKSKGAKVVKISDIFGGNGPKGSGNNGPMH